MPSQITADTLAEMWWKLNRAIEQHKTQKQITIDLFKDIAKKKKRVRLSTGTSDPRKVLKAKQCLPIMMAKLDVEYSILSDLSKHCRRLKNEYTAMQLTKEQQ